MFYNSNILEKIVRAEYKSPTICNKGSWFYLTENPKNVMLVEKPDLSETNKKYNNNFNYYVRIPYMAKAKVDISQDNKDEMYKAYSNMNIAPEVLLATASTIKSYCDVYIYEYNDYIVDAIAYLDGIRNKTNETQSPMFNIATADTEQKQKTANILSLFIAINKEDQGYSVVNIQQIRADVGYFLLKEFKEKFLDNCMVASWDDWFEWNGGSI